MNINYGWKTGSNIDYMSKSWLFFFSNPTVELDLALMQNDLAWLKCLDNMPDWGAHANRVREYWMDQLSRWSRDDLDPKERELLQHAQKQLQAYFLARELN